MLKRSRRIDSAVFVKALVCLMMLATGFSMGGCGLYTVDSIDDYENFLQTYTKYLPTSEIPGDSDITDNRKTPAEIPGFRPLYNDIFSFGTYMNGGMTFVKRGAENGVLSANGTFTAVSDDFTRTELYGDLYISQAGAYSGVNDIFGKEILPAEYDTVQIVKHTVLATKGDAVFVFVNGELTGADSFCENVYLLSDEYVYKDGYIYSVTMSLQEIAGCPYLDIPANGIVIVSRDGLYVSYADIATGKILPGVYVEAKRFADGCGIAVTESGESVVVNTSGEIIYATHSKTILCKSGNFYSYLRYNRYGIMDSEFQEITAAEFTDMRYEKAVEHYIIVRYGTGERLYDLQSRNYVGETYESIEYKDGLFFAKTSDEIVVMDPDLQTIVRSDRAEWNENVLTVFNADGVAYYVREE